MTVKPPLPYSPDAERPDPDEQATIDGIVKGMIDQSRTVEKREGEAMRASHATSTALAVGTVEVLPGLPPELAQGLFARPGTYDAAVRLAQGPGERLGDRVSTHRGMSIKLFGVEGDKIDPADGDVQDLVLASGPTFPSGTAAGFLRDGSVIGKAAGLPEGAKSAVSSFARNLNRVLGAVGAESAMADFFGHPFTHPLGEPYYSQAPLRYGEHVAKIAAFPADAQAAALRDWRLEPHADEDGFRRAAVAWLAANDAVFELRAQLWNDADAQPIEDASVEWKQEDSPFRTVAVLRLPAQDAYSAERRRFLDEEVTFRPGRGLAAHRPLGSVMRARLQVYRALSAFRHRENGVAEAAPERVQEVPA